MEWEILVCGDLCLSGEPERLVLTDPQYDPWSEVRSLVGEGEVLIANVEFALTQHDEPQPFKWANLRAAPHCVKVLDRLQVAVMGNNHVSDFGETGVRETIKELGRAGILTVGYGANLEAAMQPVVVDLAEARLAIVSLSCPTTNGENLATSTRPGVVPLGLEFLRKSIEAALPQADALLVYLHWGVEQSHDPVPDQIRLARYAIDWGADAVVGCHAHVIQSYECYRNRWIFYGLGNFLFGPVDTREVLPDGSYRRGRQEQSLSNRQSLAVKFRVVPNDPVNRLRFVAIQPLGFNQDYVPHPISQECLTVDVEQINQRLVQYTTLYEQELRSNEEPIFKSFVRNGTMAYFYNSAPISDEDCRKRRQFWRRIRRTMRSVIQGFKS